MKLVRQPNNWTCNAAAMAMVLNEPFEVIIEALGHDGSMIVGERAIAFSEAETALAAWRLGFAYTRFPAAPRINVRVPIPGYPDIDALISKIGYDLPLMLIIESKLFVDCGHAVATPSWESGIYFDPQTDGEQSLHFLPPIQYIEVFTKRKP